MSEVILDSETVDQFKFEVEDLENELIGITEERTLTKLKKNKERKKRVKRVVSSDEEIEEEKPKKKNSKPKPKLIIPTIPSDDEEGAIKNDGSNMVPPSESSQKADESNDYDDMEEGKTSAPLLVEVEVKDKEPVNEGGEEKKAPVKKERKVSSAFKVYEDGTFYIEGIMKDVHRPKSSSSLIDGIKFSGKLVDIMEPEQKKKSKKKKKGKKKKIIEEDGDGDVRMIEEDEDEDEEPEVKPNPFKEYIIYSNIANQIASPFLYLTLAVKVCGVNENPEKPIACKLISIHSVGVMDPIKLPNISSALRNTDIIKSIKAKESIRKIKGLIKQVIIDSKLVITSDDTKRFKLNEEIVQKALGKIDFEYSFIFKNAFKSSSYFVGLDMFGEAINVLTDKEIDDLVNCRENDTNDLLSKLTFKAEIKQETMDKFTINNEDAKVIFEAAKLYHSMLSGFKYGHTCLIENPKNRWNDKVVEVLRTQSSRFNFDVIRSDNSTLYCIQPTEVTRKQEIIKNTLQRYFKLQRAPNARPKFHLRVMHSYDDDNLSSDYFSEISRMINEAAVGGSKKLGDFVSYFTIFTTPNRFKFIQSYYGKRCNVLDIKEFTSKALTLPETNNKDDSLSSKANWRNDGRLTYIVIDRCHLITLSQMADLLEGIRRSIGVLAISLSLVGNIECALGSELSGRVFHDIYKSGIVEVDNLTSTSLNNFICGFPKNKIVERDERNVPYVNQNLKILIDKILKKNKNSVIHYIFKRIENLKGDEELLKTYNISAIPTFRIDTFGVYQNVIINLDKMNRSDIALVSASLQTSGVVYFYGSLPEALLDANSTKNSQRILTTLESSLKKMS